MKDKEKCVKGTTCLYCGSKICQLEQENKNLKNFVVWLQKQQYYILPLKIKEKCKELLTH